MNFPKMKFQVTSADTSSTTANKNGSIWSTNTFFERLPSKKRRNSLVVEDTGRLTSRRSSVPNDAFISINDPFRNEGGIECLRFHRSTNDICEVDSIYESTVTSSFLGQTSDSFVFNGAKKLIPVNRKGSYQVNQNVQESIDDEPSYLGFSNFDEIALNKPEEDYLNDDVTDSGVCSFSSNLQRRQHLQNLEMTDLGIPSLNPTGFTLANLRKKYNRALDKPKGGRYKWKTSLELVVAYLSFYQGCCSLVLPGNVSSKEIGAFFWIHALLMTSWALPLSYLLAIIGQFSGMGSLQVWKMVPVSWGIGLAYVVSMYVMSLVAATNVAYALYSFFLIIWNAHPHGKLPWKECTIQSSTSFMYDSCARESCQDQLRLRHSV